jgi:hypothetical protein
MSPVQRYVALTGDLRFVFFHRLCTAVIQLEDGGIFLCESWSEAVMERARPIYFDLETVALLREVLEDAWACLRPKQKAAMSRTILAERILKSAAAGERDRDRLLDAALMDFTAESATA